MPFRSPSAIPQWATKQQSPMCSMKHTPSSTADSAATKPENSNDSLLIEDLDLNDLDISPSTVRTYNPSTEEISPEDYFPFAEPDSSTFFGEQVPSVVSETCLMNDLYILVKVPTNPKQYVPTTNASSQTSSRPSATATPRVRPNRAIFCIKEEEEENSVPEPRSRIPVRIKSNTSVPCWVNEGDVFEEFASTTNIIQPHIEVPLPNEVPEQLDEPATYEVSFHNEPLSPTTQPLPCQNQIELQEVSLNSFQFKGRANVSLENYGILITPTRTPKTENLLVFQVDTEQNTERDKRKRASCFEWITKFFRRKRRRTGFVHAKVYKTYFVKWKKCSDDPEYSRCQCKTNKVFRRNSA